MRVRFIAVVVLLVLVVPGTLFAQVTAADLSATLSDLRAAAATSVGSTRTSSGVRS
jgi:hypothetical protein